jgi:diguanylate cyclase (GGDEF)-like protein
MLSSTRDEGQLDQNIEELLADPQYQDHPLKLALESLLQRQKDQLDQLERLTSISDGYQVVLQQRNQTLAQRHQKQLRQLQKIVRISDHYQNMLRDLNDALKIASTQDPLTGLFNRRLMLERLNSEVALAKRRHSPFSIALLDVDYFKRINDTYGHDTGDKVLTHIARSLTDCLRAYDICARWGGEEFLVLFPETAGDKAIEIANRLRVAIHDLRVPGIEEKDRFSVSVGLAEHDVDANVTETIKRADIAMYEAKKAGRNQVVLSPPDSTTQ